MKVIHTHTHMVEQQAVRRGKGKVAEAEVEASICQSPFIIIISPFLSYEKNIQTKLYWHITVNKKWSTAQGSQ